MVKKVKQKKEGNPPPERVVLEKLAKLAGLLMWVLRNVVKRIQMAIGRSNDKFP